MAIVQIVTGILGSGKTTTVRHLIEGTSEGTWGVVVGEYAEDGFDAQMIRASGATVRQIVASGLGGGQKSYLPPLKAFVDEGSVARVIVETSGVTDIAAVVEELTSDKDLMRKAVFGPTIVVLDAASFTAHDKHFGAQLWAQLDVADIVVINKVDKAPMEDCEAMKQRVLARNPEAQCLFTYMGQADRTVALRIPYEGFEPRAFRAVFDDSLPAEFDAFVYRTHRVVYDRVHFGHLLLNLPDAKIARFKGVLRCHDKSRCINGMPKQLDWDNTPMEGDTSIAFIGLELDERREEICALLDAEIERQHTHPDA